MTLNGSSSSGLALTYKVISGPAVAIGSTLTYAGAGTVVVEADQPGDANVTAASPVQRSVTVSPLVGPVGTATTLSTVLIISAPGTIGSINVLTQGAPNLDFTLAPGGSCAVGQTYQAGDTCSVAFTFDPTAPGARFGGISASSADGTRLANTSMLGKGVAPQAMFSPFSTPPERPFPVTGIAPEHLRIDGRGDIYFADLQNGRLEEFVAVNGQVPADATPRTAASGLVNPYNLALDGSGDVYITDSAIGIREVIAVGGVIPNNPAIRSLPLGIVPTELDIDGYGNLFSLDDAGKVLEVLAVDGVIPDNPSIQKINAGTANALALRVDVDGNIYLLDNQTRKVTEILAAGGYQTINTLYSDLIQATSIAVARDGNVYVVDPNAGPPEILEIEAIDGVLPAHPVAKRLIALPPQQTVLGVDTDNRGNVFYLGLNEAITQGFVRELDLVDPPTLTFAQTLVGQTSSDSPQSVSIVNGGNADLHLLPPVASSANPSITRDFAFTSSCPVLGPVSSPFTLQPGQSCTYQVSFSPVDSGQITGQLDTTDDSLNAQSTGLLANATQIIPLAGLADGIHFLVTGPATVIAGAPLTFSVQAEDDSNTPLPNYSGTVQFSSTDGAATLPNASVITHGAGTFSATLNTEGAQTITATDTVLTSVTGTSNTILVNSAAQTISFPQPPSPAYTGTSVLLTATGGASGNPVVFSVVSGPAMVSGNNGSTLTYTGPGTVVFDADQAAGGYYHAAATAQVTLNSVLLMEPVGTSSGVTNTLVTFQAAGTVADIRSMTSGAAGLDFSLGGGGTCKQLTAYAAGDTCTQQFLFDPTHPGQRYGSVVFSTASGTVLATTLLYGVGTGPQVTFSPGTQNMLPGLVQQPVGIAVNGRGDVFVATLGAGLIEIPVSGNAFSVGSFGNCDDVAVDGAGDVFVLSNRTTLSEVVADQGQVSASSSIVTLSNQFNALNGLKVDGLGNVYLANSTVNTSSALQSTGEIYKVIAVSGSIPNSPTVQTISTAFKGVTGIALDSSGNLFVSDAAAQAVYEVLAVNGSIPPSPTIRTLGSGFSRPSNLALDAAGDVFVSDGNAAVYELLAVDGSIPAANPAIVPLGSAFVTPEGVFVEANGNVLVADSGLPQIVKLDLADPPSLTFAQTVVGETSSDSPQAVTLVNDGNAPVLFTTPTSGSNPAISQGFTIGSRSSCPQQTPGGQPALLAPGAECTDLISFTPLQAGTISGELVSTDNSLNGSGSTQTVPLNALALQAIAPTLTFSVPNQTLGTPPFTVAAVSNSPGSITYSVVSGPATLAGSTVTLTGAGTVQLLATQAASGSYAAGSATATFLVLKQSQTISFTAPPSPIPVGAPTITLVATATSGLPVSFTLVSGPATLNGASLTVTGAGLVTIAASQAGNAHYAAAPTVTQTILVDPQPAIALAATPDPVFLRNPVTFTATLSASGPAPSGTVTFMDGTQPIGTSVLNGQAAVFSISSLGLGQHAITAVYSGKASYLGATSPPAAVTVEDFSLATSTPEVTIVHGGTATFTFSVTPGYASGLASTVSVIASGAPEGSKVNITPATIPSGAGTTPISLIIQTPDYPSGSSLARAMRHRANSLSAMASLLCAGGFGLFWGSKRRRFRIRLTALAGSLIATMVFAVLSGCGSGWNTQVWSIQMSATSGQLSHSVTATLTSGCSDGRASCQNPTNQNK